MANRTKEYDKVYQAAWREKNRDKTRASSRRYYEKKKADPEWVANCVARNKVWTDAHPGIGAIRSKYYRARSPERHAIYSIRRHYKVSLKEAEKLFERKKQGCEICGSKIRPHIDHDHVTMKVRGILCSGCNLAVGHGNESPATLRALADYLEKHQ